MGGDEYGSAEVRGVASRGLIMLRPDLECLYRTRREYRGDR
jgi:hypothetical protein